MKRNLCRRIQEGVVAVAVCFAGAGAVVGLSCLNGLFGRVALFGISLGLFVIAILIGLFFDTGPRDPWRGNPMP